MKVKYSVTLPEPQTSRVRNALEEKGMTLSGFLTGIIEEYDRELCGESSVLMKPFEEITAVELMDYLGRWVRKMKEGSEEK